MTVTTAPPAVRLSPTELLACWEALDLGEPPFLLRLRRPGYTETARAESQRLLDDALAGLARRGLSGHNLTLTGMLRAVANADYHLDIRFTGPTGDRPILGVGAVCGAHGVVLVSNDGAGPIQLLPVDGARVAGTLLGLLGPVAPGIGAPVNIPAELLDDACRNLARDSVWEVADGLRERGVPRRDATSLARMCTGIDFGGQLGATARFGGPERRGPWVVGFHRTDSGWFVQLRRGRTVTVGPADTARLMYQWRELVENLVPAG